MFRRRYEIVISEKSPRMKYLDGLRFQKSETLRRDPVWEELKKVGLIKSDVGQVEGKKEEQKVVLETNGDVETEDGAESTSVGDSGEYDER